MYKKNEPDRLRVLEKTKPKFTELLQLHAEPSRHTTVQGQKTKGTQANQKLQRLRERKHHPGLRQTLLCCTDLISWS